MKAFGVTDMGQKRSMNQDYIYCSVQSVGNLPNLYIVADGMGGHKAGEYASKYSVDRFVELVKYSEQTNIVTIIKNALDIVNKELLDKSNEGEEYKGMGTTFVAAVIDGYTLYIVNIGDSRLYTVGDSIKQITLDHSLVEELIRSGQLDRKEVRHHPEKNIITRALGASDEIIPDFFEVDLGTHDKILLCSDGLTNMIEDEEIEEIIREQRDISAAAPKLVEKANYYGGNDNISAVIVEQ